jgi:hypothetical protein
VYTCSKPRSPRPDPVGKSRLPLLFPATCSLTFLPPILRTLFQVPYPVSPAFATLTKTPGAWGYSSHSGTNPPTAHRLFFPSLTGAHFAAPLFSNSCRNGECATPPQCSGRRAVKPLSPYAATLPKNSLLSLVIATLPKTHSCKSFACHRSETPRGLLSTFQHSNVQTIRRCVLFVATSLLHYFLRPRLDFMLISGQRAKMEVVSPPRGVNSPRTTHHSGFTAATMSRRILFTAFS